MDYRSGILPYYTVSAFYIVPSIILGIICQNITAYVQTICNLTPLTALIFQLVLAIFMLYVIEVWISPSFGANWQSITPGLFFVSIFFGLQTSMYNNIFAVAGQIKFIN